MPRFIIVEEQQDDSKVDYEKMTMLEIVKTKLFYKRFRSWAPIFENKLSFFEKISPIIEDKVKTKGLILPLRRNIFKIFELVDITDIKVVILGQDPYDSLSEFSEPVAQGIAFSVPNHIKVRSSLNNIFSEINSEYLMMHQFSTDLSPWCEQGIFLLNTCLTVSLGKPASHGNIWQGFIYYVLEQLRENKNIIYLLWGAKAQEMKKYIGTKSLVLETSHPSGYSASRGFLGCGHFKKVNEILKERNQTEINWFI